MKKRVKNSPPNSSRRAWSSAFRPPRKPRCNSCNRLGRPAARRRSGRDRRRTRGNKSPEAACFPNRRRRRRTLESRSGNRPKPLRHTYGDAFGPRLHTICRLPMHLCANLRRALGQRVFRRVLQLRNARNARDQSAYFRNHARCTGAAVVIRNHRGANAQFFCRA